MRDPSLPLPQFTTSAVKKGHLVSIKYSSGDFPPTKNWKSEPTNKLSDWARLNANKILNNGCYYISPCVWGEKTVGGEDTPEETFPGYRDEDCFQSASWFCPEFDDVGGPTYAKALAEFSQFSGFMHTSKSHGKVKGSTPACDRYHVCLEADRVITDVNEYKLASKALLHIYKGADQNTYDGARCFRLGLNTGLMDIFSGNICLSVDLLIAYAKANAITVSPKVAIAPMILSGGKVNNDALNALGKFFTLNKLKSTRLEIVRAARIAFKACRDEAETFATIESLPWVVDWHGRGPNRSADLKGQVRYGISLALSEKGRFDGVSWDECKKTKCLDSRNDIVTLDLEKLPELSEEFSKEYGDKHYERIVGRDQKYVDKQRNTAKKIEYLLSDDCELEFIESDDPCGAGKSTTARILAAINATKAAPYWFAVNTNKAQKTLQEEFKKYHNIDAVRVCGYSHKECVNYKKPKDSDHAYSPKSPCNNCKKSRECAFGLGRNHWSYLLSRPVVIITHEMFIRKSNEDKLPGNAIVIVDEMISRLRSYTMKASQWDDWRKILIPIAKGMKRGYAYQNIRGLASALKKQKLLVTKNTIVAGKGVTTDETPRFKEAKITSGTLWNLHGKKLLTKDDCTGLKTWIENNSVDFPKSSVMFNGKDYEFCFSRLNDNWKHLKKFIILNGSASLSSDYWEGLTTVRSTIEKSVYPKLRFDILPVMPTSKNANQNRDYILEYATWLLETETPMNDDDSPFKDKVFSPCLITGAKPTPEEIKWAKDNKAVHLKRGSTAKGSNDANDRDLVVITSSIFSSVTSYCLEAAVVRNRKSIYPDEIWNDDGSPKIKSGSFWSDDIDDVWKRAAVDLKMQMLMRGVIRDNEERDMIVVFSVSNWRVLGEIMARIPPAEIQFFGDKKPSKTIQAFVNIWEAVKDEDIHPSYGVNQRVIDVSKLSPSHAKRPEVKQMLGEMLFMAAKGTANIL